MTMQDTGSSAALSERQRRIRDHFDRFAARAFIPARRGSYFHKSEEKYLRFFIAEGGNWRIEPIRVLVPLLIKKADKARAKLAIERRFGRIGGRGFFWHKSVF